MQYCPMALALMRDLGLTDGDFDSWGSDLHVRNSAGVRQWLARHASDFVVEPFELEVGGEEWLDVTFGRWWVSK